MPGEVITEANPPALPSRLPASTLELVPKVPHKALDKATLQGLQSFQKAACYIAGGMNFIFFFFVFSKYFLLGSCGG